MATEEYSVGYDTGFQDGWNAAIDSAPPKQPAPQDHVAWNGWVLREVFFENGEPCGHREPQNVQPISTMNCICCSQPMGDKA